MVTPGIDWNLALSPVLNDIVKAVATIIGGMLIWGIKLFNEKEKDNKFLKQWGNWLIMKAIENQIKNPFLDGSALWKKLEDDAAKMGVDTSAMQNFEANIMAGVKAFYLSLPNGQVPSSQPPLATPLPSSPIAPLGT
jgi:hypothetical protein